MTDKRAIGSFIATGALLVLLATPVAAGQTCSLQATVDGGSATVVTVGEEVLIEGFGFFPGDVFVEYSVDPHAALIGDRHGRCHRGIHDDHHAAGRRRGSVDGRGERFSKGQCTRRLASRWLACRPLAKTNGRRGSAANGLLARLASAVTPAALSLKWRLRAAAFRVGSDIKDETNPLCSRLCKARSAPTATWSGARCSISRRTVTLSVSQAAQSPGEPNVELAEGVCLLIRPVWQE